MIVRRLAATAATLIVASCGSGPRPEPPPPVHAPAPEPVAPPPPQPAEHGKVTRLDNGLTLFVTAAPDGADAQVQMTFRIGTLAPQPGLAEFAMEALRTGADASLGRSSLERTVADLGGIVRTDVGASTAWIGIRVPAARWQDAQTALLTALVAPAQPRGQLERIRDRMIEDRCAAVTARPAANIARARLLGRPDSAAWIAALLDRDPSEVGLFQSRAFRPENAVCALQVPGDPATVAAAISRPGAGGLARWTPPAIAAPTEVRRATPPATSETLWVPGSGPSIASFILPVAAERGIDAATTRMLQACLTLDGTGGRLERLLAERGLGHLQWSSEVIGTADRLAVLLTTTATPAEAARLLDAFTTARDSLRDVPPSASEIALAVRRARLTANLGQLDELSRLREQARAGTSGANVAEPPPARPGSADFDRVVTTFAASPTTLVVVGGTIPSDATGVRKTDLLPPGMKVAAVEAASPSASESLPWLDRAAEAIGGASLLRRFDGFEGKGRLQSEGAPPVEETASWRTNGSLRRVRDVLGKEIETKLLGNTWTESLGGDTTQLSAHDAAALRREYERHPLALLAAHTKNTLRFRPVAQRTVGDRDLMILQAEGDRFDRLRIHVDAGSHLIRVVEVWETLADGTTVHLQDAWSDYRTVDGLRVPFRRLTTQDEGQNRVELVWSRWQPVLTRPTAK